MYPVLRNQMNLNWIPKRQNQDNLNKYKLWPLKTESYYHFHPIVLKLNPNRTPSKNSMKLWRQRSPNTNWIYVEILA